ncbi:HK97 gp10 family phage protein [Lentibacillus amyloliquefaciens]|uniref:HK97 gp10 family phage protein n=1 Tax=Lentibacillus amyloliquefaciens TaxID=1472767 RepID=A0A0U3WC05_9BACI|nr:HK97 gp10 family phage protein [Lentibacillus amyloliquefaciens]ALX50466.1 hypothetical protein AOX59_18895 [Lentibacillus amyloliquefaciens]
MDDFAKEIAQTLSDYTDEVTEGLQEAQKDVARQSRKRLKSDSPVGDYAGGGDYAKGWRAKKIRNGGYVVHNKTDYQLTHLLEYGHAKRGGSGRVRAYPHIRKVEQQAIDEYQRRAEKVIRG